MKVALCLSGQPRFVEKAFPYIEDCLLRPNNPDVFIHTWFSSEDANKPFRVDAAWKETETNKIDPQTDRKLLEMYKPVRHVFEPQRKFSNSRLDVDVTLNTFYEKFSRDWMITSQHSMWYSIFMSNHLMNVYRLKNDIQYDYVIRCRMDAYMNRSIYCKDLSLDRIWVAHQRPIPHQIDDWFAIGSVANMNVYSSMFNMIDWSNKVSHERDSYCANEHLLYNLLERTQIKTEVLPMFTMDFIRP